jgi:hypothetical protein
MASKRGVRIKELFVSNWRVSNVKD